MTHETHRFHRPCQATDGTWVLDLSAVAYNGYAITVPVHFGTEEVLAVGSLLRVRNHADATATVLWRVVTLISGAAGHGNQHAVLVPTDLPASIPAASVARVENAVKRCTVQPKRQTTERLAA